MTNKYKVLVIGCGNIGAQYDLNSVDKILTHVKAWYLSPNSALSIFDLDQNLVKRISSEYNCNVIESVNIEELSKFDCVSICTPTNTHHNLLEIAFKANVNTIICEKPVSLEMSELHQIIYSYNENNSRVLVNYFRRFLPSFAKLKEYIQSLLLEGELLTNINIRYQRGFLNNGSHAFDLIEFLLDKETEFTGVKIQNRIYDQFDYDPTLSLLASWSNINVSVIGLSNVLFSYFEIDLYFKKHTVLIKDAGDLIEFYESQQSEHILKPLIKCEELTLTNCLKDYMKYVIEAATQTMDGSTKNENFLSAVKLNKRMLTYLEN